MDFSRRQLLLGSAQTFGMMGLLGIPISTIDGGPAPLLNPIIYKSGLGIVQGFTNTDSTQITILTEKSRPSGYRILGADNVSIPFDVYRREARTFSSFGIDKILVQNLKPNEEYRIQVYELATGKKIDERTFKALDLSKRQAKVAIASCMKDSMQATGDDMWTSMAKAQPDLVLLNGDTCYADKNNEDQDEKGYWRRYSETRSKLAWFRMRTLTPTLAIWDDHDYGTNNGNGSFAKKDMVREVFEIFWDSQERVGLKHGPGISQMITAFGQRIFMMDGRYFRSERSDNGQQWGAQQEEFLLSELEGNSDPALILNGTLFFGGYLKWESFEYDHNKNFKRILNELSKVPAPVSFVSGDIHFSELMEIEPEILGYKTYEYVSSSIHSSTFPFLHLRAKNKRRLEASSVHNFTLLQLSVDQRTREWEIHSEVLGKNMAQSYSHHAIIKR